MRYPVVMKYGVVALKAGVVVIAIVSVFLLYSLMSDRPEPSPVAWSLGDEEPVMKAYPSGGFLFIVSDSNVSMVNSSGYPIWRQSCGDVRYSSICPDGSLLAYSDDKGLIRLYANGSSDNVSVPQMTEAAADGSAGYAYIRAWDRLSLVRPDGKEAWSIGKVAFGPVVTEAGDAAYAVVRDGAKGYSLLYVSENGTILWNVTLVGHDVNGMAPDGESGAYVYDSAAGGISRFDPSGATLWSYTTPGGGPIRHVLCNDGRHVILSRGTVTILDADGVTVSRHNHNLSMAGAGSPAALEGDSLYIAGPGPAEDTFVLYALRPDGSVRWSLPAGGSAPVDVYAGNGVVCAATELMDGHRLRPVLYILNDTGTDAIRYFSEDGRPWAQVIVVPGHVYARTYGGRLFAFDK